MLFVVNRNTKEVLLAKKASKLEPSWGVYNDDYDAIWVDGKSKDVDVYCTRKDGKLYLNFEYNN